jgi:hypothetical protein
LENSQKILLIDEHILKDIHILKLNILGYDNVVVDALSRKSYANATMVSRMPRELYKEFEQLNLDNG